MMQKERSLNSEARRNYTIIFTNMSLFHLGFNLISPVTILPVYVSHLTDSNILIGMVPAFVQVAFALPQLFGARYYERKKYAVPYMWRVNFTGRVIFGAYGLSAIFFAERFPELWLVLFFLALGIFRGGVGFQSPGFTGVYGKVISPKIRGRVFGYTSAVGGALGAVGALIAAMILGESGFPEGFGVLLAFGGFFLAAVNSTMLLLKEPPSEVPSEPPGPIFTVFRRFPSVLQNDIRFRRYIIARTLLGWGTLSFGFFAVFGISRYEATAADVAIFTAILLASQPVLSLIWGQVADKTGPTVVPVFAGLLSVAAAMLAVIAPNIESFAIVFVLVGGAFGGYHLADFAAIYQMAPSRQLLTYAAVFALMTQPAALVAAIAGGWLVDTVGFNAMFVIAAGLSVAGVAAMTLVPDATEQKSSARI